MPDGSGNIQTTDTVSKYVYVQSINQRLTDNYTNQIVWGGGARPSTNFPLSLLGSTTYTDISIGDIPTTSPNGYVHHNDIGPILQTFCEQFTLLRNCNYIEYQTTSGYPSGNGDIEMLNVSGYINFIEGASDPGGAYTFDDSSVPINAQTITTDFTLYNIDTGDPNNSGTPYTPNGFNDFVNALQSDIQNNAIDQVVTITYTYCHDLCYTNCYGKCSHTYSDERLKDIIAVEGEFLPGIRQILFRYKNDNCVFERRGVIAQDVQKVFPELVEINKAGFLLVNYRELRKRKQEIENYPLF